MTEEVWRERDTTPSKIEAALRNLLIERYHDEDAFVPARVLNLVVVVDGEFRGEVENRLERVGRYPPSRLVVSAGRGWGTASSAARWRTGWSASGATTPRGW